MSFAQHNIVSSISPSVEVVIDDNCVLCGQKFAPSQHQGNLLYREQIRLHKEEYRKCKKKARGNFVRDVYIQMRNINLRFVCEENNRWRELNDEEAIKKIAQALRENRIMIESDTNDTINEANNVDNYKSDDMDIDDDIALSRRDFFQKMSSISSTMWCSLSSLGDGDWFARHTCSNKQSIEGDIEGEQNGRVHWDDIVLNQTNL